MKRATTSLPVPDSPVNKHRRLCVCHARGVREDVLPLLRLTDDATMTAARFELAGQCGDLRFEPCGRLARLRLAARRLRQPLVREGECQVIRDAAREVDVVFAEAIRSAQDRKKSDPKTLVPSGIGTRKGGAHAEAPEDLAAQAVGGTSASAS